MSTSDVRQMILHDEECAWVETRDRCDCTADRVVTVLADRLDNAERAIEKVRELHHEVQRAWSGGMAVNRDGKSRALPTHYIRSCSCGNDTCPVLAALDGALTPTTESVPRPSHSSPRLHCAHCS